MAIASLTSSHPYVTDDPQISSAASLCFGNCRECSQKLETLLIVMLMLRFLCTHKKYHLQGGPCYASKPGNVHALNILTTVHM